MAATTQQQGMHWRDKAIAQAAIVSDSWQVALAWLGRFAEIILFVCMIIMLANIVIPFPGWFVGGVLVVQMITLDVAAFGLGTMASHVKQNGHEEAAQKAETMSKALIVIMIITALNVVIDLRFGSTYSIVHTITGYVDDALIFVRIVAVILYGHTIRSLREVSQAIEVAKQDETEEMKDQIAQLQKTLRDERQRAAEVQTQLRTDLQSARSDFALQLEALTHSQNMTLQTAESQNTVVSNLQNQLQNALSQVSLQSAKMDELTTDLQNSAISLQTANQKIADLQNQLQETKLQTQKIAEHDRTSSAKPTAHNVTSIDQARAKHEVVGSSKAKVSDTEILAFIAANPGMKNADIAQKLGISERKIYLAKSSQTANADAVNE